MTTYYVRATVASGTVSSDLTNFPVVVNLAGMPAGFWTHLAHSNGGDIRVETTGGSLLPIDMVTINTGSQTGTIVFLADTIHAASNSSWDIHYGDSSNTLLPATDTHGRNAVWAAYHRVFIFSDMTDRTGSGNNATLVGSPTFDASGNLQLNGTNQWAYTSSVSKFTTWTAGINANLTSVSGSVNQAAFMYNQATDNTNNFRTGVIWRQSASPKKFGLWDTTNSWLQGSESATVASTWYRVNASFNGTTQRAEYVNGVQTTQSSVTQKPSGTAPMEFVMGNDFFNNASEALGGLLNYAYLAGSVFSAAWIAAENANWNGSSFYSLGSEQTATNTETGTVAMGWGPLGISIGGVDLGQPGQGLRQFWTFG